MVEFLMFQTRDHLKHIFYFQMFHGGGGGGGGVGAGWRWWWW